MLIDCIPSQTTPGSDTRVTLFECTDHSGEYRKVVKDSFLVDCRRQISRCPRERMQHLPCFVVAHRITLYTMENMAARPSLCSSWSTQRCARRTEKVKPWRHYVWMLCNALAKLPVVVAIVGRALLKLELKPTVKHSQPHGDVQPLSNLDAPRQKGASIDAQLPVCGVGCAADERRNAVSAREPGRATRSTRCWAPNQRSDFRFERSSLCTPFVLGFMFFFYL
jgi:hypothetical protein